MSHQGASQPEGQAASPKVAIVTDSVAQVPEDLARRLNVSVVPFPVILDNQVMRDGVDLAADELYRRMREERAMPSTSHPSVGEYVEAFRRPLAAGAMGVLHIGLAQSVSAAIVTATKAAEMVRAEFPDKAVEVFDSGIVTIAQGFIVMEAATLAAQGASMAEVKARAEHVRARVGFVASLDTLEYLARGGRIGRVSSMLGSLLRVKPIVTVNAKQGVIPLARARGNHASLTLMVEHALKVTGRHRVIRLGIMQAAAPERAAQLREMAEEALRPAEVYLTDLTPVMGAHAGPGVVGLAYQWE